MYRQSAAAHGLDLGRSFYIGDKLSDVLPALELGGLGVLVRTGYGRELEAEAPDAVHVVDDLEEAAGLIVSRSLR
jgi:D-glycero-D-manno-heptose 1,7-bisphosphate phosphatase